MVVVELVIKLFQTAGYRNNIDLIFDLDLGFGDNVHFVKFYKFLRSLFDQEFAELQQKEKEEIERLAREEAERKAIKEQFTPGRLKIPFSNNFVLRDMILKLQSDLDKCNQSFVFSPFDSASLRVRTKTATNHC